MQQHHVANQSFSAPSDINLDMFPSCSVFVLLSTPILHLNINVINAKATQV